MRKQRKPPHAANDSDFMQHTWTEEFSQWSRHKEFLLYHHWVLPPGARGLLLWDFRDDRW